jgi:hypothetical protein
MKSVRDVPVFFLEAADGGLVVLLQPPALFPYTIADHGMKKLGSVRT